MPVIDEEGQVVSSVMTEGAGEAAQVPAVPIEEHMAKSANLSDEELRQIDEFSGQIDLSNTAAILNYGVGTQRKLADFSEKTLESVRTKDMGEVGNMVTDLVVQLKDFDTDDDKGFFGNLLKKSKNKAEALKTRYSKVETNVTAITNELEKHQVTLLKDVDMLDKMYDMNLSYYKELTMYVLAGKKKLESVRANELVEAQKQAQASGLPEDAQRAKDIADQCDRFEKKLHDLELTRTVAMQTGPQIRLMQSSDTAMAEKIQSTIVNTIPLWKNQMVIALGIEHSAQAAKAQKAVSDTTNELLKKNADKLKIATVENAKEVERGIVDIETLKHTNEQLISTLDEVMKIQAEGREKRKLAEQELVQIEDQLKNKILEAAGR
ncbi:MAG: toxic anion resistance protein [Lachnospiraceae bacterium]|nr:toxic anion resistance protein [Lachnospiraceae bacterium]